MFRRVVPLALAAALLVPASARAFVSIEALYGISRPASADFDSALSGARNDPDLFDNSLQIAGGTVLFNLGGLQLGAIVDSTFKDNAASQTAVGGLLGFRLDLGALRIDLLGEAGGHRFGNFLEDRSVLSARDEDVWLAYVGLRPGVSFRLGTSPIVLGVWAFARWDLTDKDVPITVRGADDAADEGTLGLGGTTLGAALRLGFEL
jgi:hypothetical protein